MRCLIFSGRRGKGFEEEYGESLEAFDGVLIRNLESLMWLRKKAIQNLSGGIIISMYATGKAESSCTDRGLHLLPPLWSFMNGSWHSLGSGERR